MPLKKTYYEILGVPRTATLKQIKRQYRLLVRRYHPDVAEDKAAAKTAFIEISEAYQTLSNPDKRVIYDASLDVEMFRPTTSRRTRPETPRTTQYRRPTQTSGRSRAAEVQRLLREAQLSFIQGNLQSAVSACRQVQSLDSRNVQAYTILGDVYRVRGQIDNAIAMFTIASQLDPGNNQIQAQLNRLARQSRVSNPTGGGQRQAILKMGLNLMCWPVIIFMMILLYFEPGEPVPWLRQNLPIIGDWSLTLLVVLGITGGLSGFLISVNELVERIDDALFFQSVHAPGAKNYPIGLIVIVLNFLSFYIAAAIYAIISLVQENRSRSVAKAFAAAFALVLLASVMYQPGQSQVFLFGGNVILPAMLLGWMIGDLFRPGW